MPDTRSLVPIAGRVGTLRNDLSLPSAAARRRAEKLVADVKRRKKRIASDFYEMGRALSELSEPRCYRALGYESFDDLLRGRKLVSRMQAHKLVEVAQTYPKNVALELGIEKAYLLKRFVEATPTADVAAELARRNARIAGRRISDVTVGDLREATNRLKRGAPAAAASTVLREAKKKARSVQRELRARGAERAVVRAEAEGGGAVLVVRVPVEQADALLGDV